MPQDFLFDHLLTSGEITLWSLNTSFLPLLDFPYYLYWCNFLHELSVLGKINETLIFSVAILFCWAIFYQDPAAHQKCSPPMLVWDPPVPNCRFGGTRLHTRRPLTGRWEPPDPMGRQPKCSISWESQESHTFFWRDVFGQESSMFVVHQKDLLSKVKQIHFYFMFRNRW